jgi:hypothetical protein
MLGRKPELWSAHAVCPLPADIYLRIEEVEMAGDG